MASHFQWERGFDWNLLLGRIAEARKVSGGKCSFDAFEYAFWLPVINSAIRADKIVGSLKAQCIKKALGDPAVTLKDSQKFLDRCNRAYDDIAKTAKQNFIMLCHITYSGPKLFDSIREGHCRVSWQPQRSNRFLAKAYSSRNELVPVLTARGVPQSIDGLTALLVRVEAYNPEHAHELSTDIVDRVRGILNLIVNSTRRINIFYGLSKPHAINRFRLGPYRTLHHKDGSLAIKMFWYEPRWSHEQDSAKFKGDAKKTKAGILKWWKRAQSNPLRGVISDGLLRYCRALDQHETDAALLGLWGALEHLTGTVNEKYDLTVDRIVRLFKDHIDARQIAQHVRLRRNSTVHAARSPSDEEIEPIILQAEKLVSQILFFCIKEGRYFRNERELINFLDLSMNHELLVRHKALINRFIKYQNR